MRFKHRPKPNPYEEWVYHRRPCLVPYQCLQCKDMLWLEPLYIKKDMYGDTMTMCATCHTFKELQRKSSHEASPGIGVPGVVRQRNVTYETLLP